MRRRDFLRGSLVAGVGTLGAAATSVAAVPARAEADATAEVLPFNLRCESRREPLGIGVSVPRLSWKLRSIGDARNQFQSAYRIMVASSPDLLTSRSADLWDSDRVDSNEQLHVEYSGKPLASGQRCYWQVEIWDQDGRKSASSRASWWEMGLMASEDWTGHWISDGKPLSQTDEAHYQDDPAPLLRRSFQVNKSVRRARLYATSLGYHELRLNGQRISDNALDPAWTNVDERILYSCHDLTDHIDQGENILGAMLGNGWFNPLPLRMWGRINITEHLPVGRPRLMAQLVVDYEDGTSQRISSDESWKVSGGPLLRNSVYLGEKYDARLEQPGWDRPGFDESQWSSASRAPLEGARPGLRALPMPPIRVTNRLAPVSVNEVSDGVYIFDFGQNFAGWVRLRVQGPRGATVQMRMGELVYDDGTLNPMTAVSGQIKRLTEEGVSVGGPGAPEVAWQANLYTLRGGEEEEYTPRFTFHGFRYVEVTGFPGTPDLNALEGLRLNTDVESVGSFECSNGQFNRIQKMVQWTLLSNLFSVQSDCPAREKFQYGGDIVASSEMAIFNYDMSTFYAKAVDDFRDSARDGWFTETAPYVGIAAANYVDGAGPIGWGLAHPLLMAQLYQYYGDRRTVEEHFEAAKIWVDLLEENSDGYIIDRCIGDHESLDPKPIELIATAQFCQASTLVSGFADLLGDVQAANHYARLSMNIRQAFIERFLEEGSGRFDIATQAAQSTALELELCPADETEKAIDRMVEAVLGDHEGHVATGIFGTKYLLNNLSSSGRADVAYSMVNQPDYPGWIHMMENGATTLWETWAQSDNVYSQNHPMFGMVSEWFFKTLGGIQPAPSATGFNRFTVAPFASSDLDWVDVSYESVRGRIASRWSRSQGQIQLEVEIPANTEAIVEIPTSESDSVTETGRSIEDVDSVRRLEAAAPGRVRMAVGSGMYVFTAAAP